MLDPFRPRQQLAQFIYDGILSEAEKRKGIDPDVWVLNERQNVRKIARDYAQQHGLRIPTMGDIERAENLAIGHVDYAAKWANAVSRCLYTE